MTAHLAGLVVWVVVCLLCAGFISAPAWAAEATEADAAFREGSRQFDLGNYVAAAWAFERADALMAHGVSKLSAGLAWQAAGEPARAADSFAAALESGQLSVEQQSLAQKSLATLTPDLGQLTVPGPAGAAITVGHLRERQAPLRAHLEPGVYELHAVLPGGDRIARSLTITKGQIATVRLGAGRPQPAPFRPSAARAAPEDDGADGAAQPVLGWICLGTGVVAGAVAIGLGSAALSARDDYFDSEFRDAEARDKADDYRTATNVTLVAAAVLGATGGVLLLTSAASDDDSPSSSEEATLHLGPGSLTLSGRF